MEVYELQTARTGAKSGFMSSFSDLPGPPKEGKAHQFFEEHSKNTKEPEIVIHDREYPQPPPHYYIPGPPGPLNYGVPMSDGYDAGVFAVSSALFGGGSSGGAFRNIPIQFRSVFRRRRRGDCLPEWSNAFVTRVDPCECINPEETYTPYEVARYRDQQGRMRTTLDFVAESVQIEWLGASKKSDYSFCGVDRWSFFHKKYACYDGYREATATEAYNGKSLQCH